VDLTQFSMLTFDCFGTLINWERGILGTLRPILGARRIAIGDDEILRLYSAFEGDAEAAANVEYRTYREVLGEVMEEFGRHFSLSLTAVEREALADSLAEWPAFADTAAALRKIKRHAKVGVLSNVDDELFAATRGKLGIDLDLVVTAQLCRSYKPMEKHWKVARALTQLPKEKMLHVAESRFHDIVPARSMGYSTVWVNRRGGQGRVGGGASEGNREIVPYEATADLEVPDVETLARLVESAWGEKRF
jgi:2-haloacid dehalogenase